MTRRSIAALGLGALVSVACSDTDDGLPTTGPTEVAQVASEGFQNPGDAVASPNGQTFYFTAFTLDTEPLPAVFSVPAAGGPVQALHSGSPFSLPTGLVMSCDGQTLYAADMGTITDEDDEDALDDPANDGGHIYSLATAGGPPTPLTADGIFSPTGMALSVDCTTLYVTGWDPSGQPALFTVPVEGGAAQVIHAGAPLMSVSGVHVDEDNVAWVMDHVAEGETGQGVLFSITPAGEVTAVVDSLRMGTPGGVSLAAGGETAVIPTLDEQGNGQLETVSTVTGEMNQVAAPEIQGPAGIRTAREAPVFVVVDSEASAIFRAQ